MKFVHPDANGVITARPPTPEGPGSPGVEVPGATGALQRPFRVPVSTYRVQLQPGFGFRDIASVVPYLASLGITECYVSPYFKARPGSTHGYDICDHNSLNPELGSSDDFNLFLAQLAAHGIGQLLDFVPNHMGIDPRTNPWWRDVLENGPSSVFARYFDIDWEPTKTELRNKVLLPILSHQYGEALESGAVQLCFLDGTLAVNYQDRQLPTNARETVRVYRYRLEQLDAAGRHDGDIDEFLSIITQLENLSPYTDRSPERSEERRRETAIAHERLLRLTAHSSRIREHIDLAIGAFNGCPGVPESFDLLHDFLERQPYRLAYWRTSAHEINYRRFFDVDDLAGLRMETEEVFEATHQLLSRLIGERKVTGVRIDHPDGLFAPAEYFRRLQSLAARALADGAGPRSDANGGSSSPLYVLVEKILTSGHQLPDDWSVHGTTGYQFMNMVNGLFVCSEHAKAFRELAARVTGRQDPFSEVIYTSKKLIMETALASELNVLAHALNRISEQHRRSRDFTLNSLRNALIEFIGCLPVYRTYVDEQGSTRNDRETIVTAVGHARRRNPALEASIFDFLLDVIFPRHPDDTSGGPYPDGAHQERRVGYPPAGPADYAERIHFAMRLQQYTGPVHAKGVEDTAFYRHNVLLSLNEVGGSPSRFGVAPAEFHHGNLLRRERWPLELLATATHDAKLGEDVRARLNALSEMPDAWRRAVGQWLRINAVNRTQVGGEWAPDRNDEYRFYQVLLGVWPPESIVREKSGVPPSIVERVRAYMLKAAKEAKVYTSWINDNERYDVALQRFVEQTLSGQTAPRFLESFTPVAGLVARLGMFNSLSQLVLKIASPGVPDFYQGTELWDLNLVDPDNRRPVDYLHRSALLQEIEGLLDEPVEGRGALPVAERVAKVQGMLSSWEDGRIKLFVTASGLRLRRQLPELFFGGEYIALETDLTVEGGIVAFARRLGDRVMLAVVPRLVSRLVSPDGRAPIGLNAWRTSRVILPSGLADGTYHNVLTGEIVRPMSARRESWILAGDALASCPVALLIRESTPNRTGRSAHQGR